MAGTINEEIQVMIDRSIGQQPTLQLATVTKTYNDGHVDVSTKGGDLSYVRIIGSGSVGDDVLLCFLENDVTLPLVVGR